EQAKQSAAPIINENTQLWGPVPAPMERRAGRYRAQLIIQSIDRKSIQTLLKRWVPLLGRNKQTKVRWSIDVDPQDML
ncbi:MAG: primosomal protein N', partial [Gammaproteobacteria bacterium]